MADGEWCCLCGDKLGRHPQRAVGHWTDRWGYTYHLCARHYEPIRRALLPGGVLAVRETRRRAGGILTADDFLRDDDEPQ